MRRLIATITMMFLLLFFCFATDEWSGFNTSASTTLTAYKSEPAPIVIGEGIEILLFNRYVTSQSNPDGILGTNSLFPIAEADLVIENKRIKLSDALILEVSSNSKSPILVDLWFSPFINTRTVDNEYIYTYVSTKWEYASYTNPNSENVTLENNTYQYRLDLAMKDLSGSATTNVEATNASGATMKLTFTPVALQNNTVVNMPSSDGSVLPGLDDEQYEDFRITGTLVFSLFLGVSKFDEIPANKEFTANVRITIQGN